MTSLVSQLSSGFEPPEKILLGNFYLEALSPKHNNDDYEAWFTSKENIIPLLDPQDRWMENVSSKEANLQDLTKDYQEILDKKTFRYSILSPDAALYQGCFYIRPTSAEGYNCLVEYWFTDKSKHLETQFHGVMKEWLKNTWKFDMIALPGREMSWEEYHSLERE